SPSGLHYGDARFISLMPDGKFVVTGAERAGIDDHIVSVRYDNARRRDTSFGESARVTTRLGDTSYAQSAAVDEAGRLTVVAFASVNGTQRLSAARYHPDGSSDMAFGTAGIIM